MGERRTRSRYLRDVADSGGTSSALAAELSRLVERVRPWSLERWSARATGGEGSRAEAAYLLVVELAALTPSTPDGARPSRLRDLSLADQLAVVGRESIRWIDEHDGTTQAQQLAVALLERVRATRAALEVAPLG